MLGAGGGFGPTRSTANLPSRPYKGSLKNESAFFSAAFPLLSAPLGCSPHRSLSRSPRPPEAGLYLTASFGDEDLVSDGRVAAVAGEGERFPRRDGWLTSSSRAPASPSGGGAE